MYLILDALRIQWYHIEAILLCYTQSSSGDHVRPVVNL